MIEFKNFDELVPLQLQQYRAIVASAFPEIILQSEVVKNCWTKVERYFPEFQRSWINESNDIVGIINTIPFFWDRTLRDLPNDGWDWLMQKGISDFENEIKPNVLGGLQIIINKENQGKGLSKSMIAEGKRLVEEYGFDNLVIPIRPTQKHRFPEMAMDDYMNYKVNNKIFDPWIRTHVNSGAQIISVCDNSMNVKGDLLFWEQLMNKQINASGQYKIKGALSPVNIDMKTNVGEYREPNIWLSYN